MEYFIVDIEADNLLEEVTKIHCLCWKRLSDGKTDTLTDYSEIKAFVENPQHAIIGHYIIQYDIPVIEKITGASATCAKIDTLALSWYLYPQRDSHNLENWGTDLGIAKPEVKDWKNLSVEDYIHRCTQDVLITELLWIRQKTLLEKIYGENGYFRLVNYLTFKMECAAEQEMVKWKLDVDRCRQALDKLLSDRDIREKELAKNMPDVIQYSEKKRPKVMYRKDGTLSSAGEKWFSLLRDMNAGEDTESIVVENGTSPANPGSVSQIKDWLFSLGWKPVTFEFRKSKTGMIKKVPQITDKNKNICESIRLLYEKEPSLHHLEGLSIINHRIGILDGFLKTCDKEGFVKARIQGLTNTLRFQHTTVVNLPTVHKPYGKDVRGCLTVPSEEYLLCGADMSSLEDSTKQHYMYRYDPEYVNEMRNPCFDPHVDIGVLAEMMTQEQSVFYRWMDGKPIDISLVEQKYLDMTEEERKAEFKKLSSQRKDSKQVNFSAVYGAGPPKISLTTGMSLEKATKLHQIYWTRNWAVKKISKNCLVKTVDGQMWLYNPVSSFWYSLRFEKDKFSTLNQGTGVYCFDTWVRNVRSFGIKLCGQFHDEIAFPFISSRQQEIKEILLKAIDRTNEQLNLNVKLGISIAFGKNYAETH